MEDYANKLREILVWYLQHHIVPRFIQRSYSSIDASQLKSMLGKLSDAKVKASVGLTADKGFVDVPMPKLSETEFAVSQKRVEEMTTIVRFLEQKKYDVKETAAKQIAEEKAANDAMIAGKKIK